ncbi:radical SAM/SPASM domain-containing protein [Aliarcobacter butzleri]|uniref:radical SAM/SPASM domain-containing protein n=1 Tax=Aliarcobacter butzleri TaxID=28197 RepID=UPI0021B1B251|nr:radical SAM/SPASM domain-containing protein [Aliarcobacter butzleri]MCT7605865.1 radical SAM protein [Aliarcobacter butzleri]MCT7608132.1 radical SAM protein [Aliarcobacter butzleri]
MLNKQNIPINKGNYSSFETKEREELFEKYKSEGWEKEYKQYRTDWSKFPNERMVNEYPLLVDLELASVCNLKCPMCYTITDEFKEKVNAKLMDFNLFKKIIDEIGGKVPALRLSLRGESTLHPKFIECIKYAKDKGIKEISTLTNGSKLKLEFFQKMVDAGIDWITISVDGLDDEYEKIRKPLKFKDTLEKITQMNKYKSENNLHKPVIKIQSLWPAIKKNPTKFYNTFEPITDLIAFNPLIDYLQKDSDIVYIDNFSCPQLYQRLVIGADGSVMMCSNDEENDHIIGNANSQTVHEIWHGEPLNKVRELHKQKDGYKNLDVCKRCYLPRATESSEISEVNGRDFNILNYVNRAQNVGE